MEVLEDVLKEKPMVEGQEEEEVLEDVVEE